MEKKVAQKPAGDRKFSDNQVALEAKEAPELTDTVIRLLQGMGLIEVMDSYVGRPPRLSLIAVQLNEADNTDFLYYSRFQSTGLKPGKACYLHVDSGLGFPLKVLIYLTEVGEENGPFQYVLGSNRHADRFDLLVRKTTDALGPTMPLETFLALPPEFRRRTHFGFELPDNHPATARLLRSERRFLSSAGDLICFDVNGIHRGGMVEKDRRVLLQLLFS